MASAKNSSGVKFGGNFVAEFDCPSENHRRAAYHHSAATKEHELAAEAYDAGFQSASEFHSFRAYRYQLKAVHFSENAIMDAFIPQK